MKASDIYGNQGVGTATTQDMTQPQTGDMGSQKENAKHTAFNLSNPSYGLIALLAFIGILIGIKFAAERKKA